MSAAFNTVRCRTLVDKMRVYGFSQQAMDWSSSYMNGRTQRVQIGSALSPPIQINTGVPQGSILGPLFYNILTNDLLSSLERDNCPHHKPMKMMLFSSTCTICASVIVYADDTMVCVAGKANLKIENKLKHCSRGYLHNSDE